MTITGANERQRGSHRAALAAAAGLAFCLALPGSSAAQGSQGPPAAGAADPSQEPEPITFNVTVIGTTPLSGVDLELARIPAPIQVATDRDVLQSGALDLADLVNRRMSGVHINEVQGNPFQPDVNYRGYTASPLLGTPQGLSVYMDGVRLNQPLGDVVSWDLIPRVAIASGALMPGSNPLFGLNTLGGALSIHTKDGRTSGGTSADILFGSDRRRAVEVEHGGSRASGLHWYLAGNYFAEDGWREDSPSDVRQLFGKLGRLGEAGDVSLTLAYADNSLHGNALQEAGFLDREFDSVYTRPDITDNRSAFVNLSVRRLVAGAATFSGNAYFRRIRTSALSGDLNEASLDQAVYQPSAAERAALAAARYSGFPASGADAANTPFPFWRCLGHVLTNDEPALMCNALINRGRSLQRNGGAAGQLTRRDTGAGRVNQLTAGAAYDRSTVAFQQTTELAYLNPDRSVTGVGAFADGRTGGEVDGEPFDTRVDLDGTAYTWSAYGADTLSLGNAWHLTVSGRYNRTRVANRDSVQPGGGPGSLDGTHTFARLNPAAGLTFSPAPGVNLYASYSEGSRAPSSIELGCADPDEPCKLPNAVTGDPPLDQVVTRTWESGLRGQAGGLTWSAGLFRASNHRDILFVTSEQTGFGYFRNFGRTLRQGFDVNASLRVGAATIGAGYTFLDATYQSEETVNGEGNSSNDAALSGARGLEGSIEIEPGDRIPLAPRHTLKAYGDFQATSALALDVGVVAVSSSFARGNENNEHKPDGVYYLGAGEAPGYAVMHVGASYRLRAWLSVVGQIDNLLDRRYYTSAQLGPTGFTGAGAFVARPFPPAAGEFPIRHATFFAPGAPIRGSIGARVAF